MLTAIHLLRTRLPSHLRTPVHYDITSRRPSDRTRPRRFTSVLLPPSWWRGTVVERRSLTGELSLSCARPAADGWPLMWVNGPYRSAN